MDPKILKLFAGHAGGAAGAHSGAKMTPTEYTQRATILRASLAPIVDRIREKLATGDKKGPEMDRLLRSGAAIIGVLHQYDKNVTIVYEPLI